MGNNIGLDNTQKFGDMPKGILDNDNNSENNSHSHNSHNALVKKKQHMMDVKEETPLFVPKGQLRRNGTFEKYSLRYRIFQTFENPMSSQLSRAVSIAIIVCIIVSCGAYMIVTLKGFQFTPDTCANPVCEPGEDAICTETICSPEPLAVFDTFEMVIILIFSSDYIIRMSTVHAATTVVVPRRRARR